MWVGVCMCTHRYNYIDFVSAFLESVNTPNDTSFRWKNELPSKCTFQQFYIAQAMACIKRFIFEDLKLKLVAHKTSNSMVFGLIKTGPGIHTKRTTNGTDGNHYVLLNLFIFGYG